MANDPEIMSGSGRMFSVGRSFETIPLPSDPAVVELIKQAGALVISVRRHESEHVRNVVKVACEFLAERFTLCMMLKQKV